MDIFIDHMRDKIRDNKTDILTTKNLDFHQRQIKNAHESIDDYDYVVRKELKDGLQSIVDQIGSSSSGVSNRSSSSSILSGGGAASKISPLILRINSLLNQSQKILDLSNGDGILIKDMGNGVIRISMDQSSVSQVEPVVEIPTGALNGFNSDFTLKYVPLDKWLVLSLNGAVQSPYKDYTLTDNAISYAQVPLTTDQHVAWYLKGANASEAANIITLVSAPGSGKIFLEGYVLGTDPVGWNTIGFDDSAWASPLLEDDTVTASPVTGSNWICVQVGNISANNGRTLFRLSFNLSKPVKSYSFSSIQGVGASSVSLNGGIVALGSFVVGENLLTIAASNGFLDSPTYISYKLVINT